MVNRGVLFRNQHRDGNKTCDGEVAGEDHSRIVRGKGILIAVEDGKKAQNFPASKILTVKEELKSQPKSTGTKIPSKEKKKEVHKNRESSKVNQCPRVCSSHFAHNA